MGKLRLGDLLALVWATAALCLFPAAVNPANGAREDLMVMENAPGKAGGRLVVALRSEPKTLNPVLAIDDPSRDVIRCLSGDLIHINRETLKTGPALAKSWNVSPDGRTYTLHLRQGLRFSDGEAFSADDVVFTFQVYLDEKIHSPQRDLLVVGGKPIEVKKLDSSTVQFSLARPYAAAERIFDGIAILPRHLLEKSYRAGQFSQAWNLSTAPNQFAGLGPFRLEGVHRRPAYRSREESVLLEARWRRRALAIFQRTRLFVCGERGCAGDSLRRRRHRYSQPVQC